MSVLSTVGGIVGGPVGVIGGWFASLWGKAIGVLAILGVISVALGSIYFSFKDSIQAAEDSKLALQQQRNLVKQKDDQIKRLQAIQDITQKAEAAQTDDDKSIGDQADAVQEWIKANGTGASDRPASDVITQTFDRLYGKAKVK